MRHYFGKPEKTNTRMSFLISQKAKDMYTYVYFSTQVGVYSKKSRGIQTFNFVELPLQSISDTSEE